MSKVLPGYETFLLVPAYEDAAGVPWIVTPTGLVDYENPTSAALNVYQAITKPSDTYSSQGGNISCAILDDLTLGITSSDTDSSKTICSKGNSEALTLINFEAQINIKRDSDPTADSLWNLAHNLTRAPDVPYFIVHRVRGAKDSSQTFASGDEVDLYYVHTDNQIPDYADNEPIKAGQTFIPKAIVNNKHTLAS